MLAVKTQLYLVTCVTFFACLRTNAFEITDNLNEFDTEQIQLTVKQLGSLKDGDRKVRNVVIEEVNRIVQSRLNATGLHELKVDQSLMELRNATIILDRVLHDNCNFKLMTKKGKVNVKLYSSIFTTGNRNGTARGFLSSSGVANVSLSTLLEGDFGILLAGHCLNKMGRKVTKLEMDANTALTSSAQISVANMKVRKTPNYGRLLEMVLDVNVKTDISNWTIDAASLKNCHQKRLGMVNVSKFCDAIQNISRQALDMYVNSWSAVQKNNIVATIERLTDIRFGKRVTFPLNIKEDRLKAVTGRIGRVPKINPNLFWHQYLRLAAARS